MMWNIFSDSENSITASDLKKRLDENDIGVGLIDVRSPDEFYGGSIPNAINIPIDGLVGSVGDFARYTEVYLFCHSGGRSARARKLLREAGVKNTKDLSGGITEWARQGLPISTH